MSGLPDIGVYWRKSAKADLRARVSKDEGRVAPSPFVTPR